MTDNKHDAIMEIMRISRENNIIYDELEPYFKMNSCYIGNNFSIQCIGKYNGISTLDYRLFFRCLDEKSIEKVISKTKRNAFEVCTAIQNLIGVKANVYLTSASKDSYIYDIILNNSYNDSATLFINFLDENKIGTTFDLTMEYEDGDFHGITWSYYFSENIEMRIRNLSAKQDNRREIIYDALKDSLKYSSRDVGDEICDKIKNVASTDKDTYSYLVETNKSNKELCDRKDILIHIKFH